MSGTCGAVHRVVPVVNERFTIELVCSEPAGHYPLTRHWDQTYLREWSDPANEEVR